MPGGFQSDGAGSEAGEAGWWRRTGNGKGNDLGRTVPHSINARLGMKRRTPPFNRVQIINKLLGHTWDLARKCFRYVRSSRIC